MYYINIYNILFYNSNDVSRETLFLEKYTILYNSKKMTKKTCIVL